jgi:hypothetical protein
MALMGLALFNCQKNEVVPETDKANQAAARTTTAAVVLTPLDCDNISFTGASGLLASITSDKGVLIDVESHNPHSPGRVDAAMIFNSSSPFYTDGEDLDLGTPGFGNSANLGNIVVLQNFRQYGNPLIPNDDDISLPGGFIEFIFPAVVTANSIDAIDVEADEDEGGTIQLYGVSDNLLGEVTIPATGANGVKTIPLGNVAGVKRVKINIIGSSGFDNLAFCTVAPPPPGSGCTFTQGYWKNHAEAWPVNSLMLGTVSYSKAQLLQIFKTEVKGNGLISLAHQLIAAKLNVAKGADPTAISAAIAQADLLIGSKNVLSGGYIHPSQTSALNDKLDEYNRGVIGPGHCK